MVRTGILRSLLSPISRLDMALELRWLSGSTIDYSVRVSGGGTDSFHGFEYFGLITLVSREFRVHSMQFFWRACVVYAFYGFVSVAYSCDPTFIAYSHSLPIVRCLYWFFRHVWYLVLCFSWSVCAACADGSCAGSCCCRGGGFFPNSAVFVLVLGLSVLFKEFALVFLGCTCSVAFSLRMPLLRLGHRLW